jgi:hypothetical protein
MPSRLSISELCVYVCVASMYHISSYVAHGVRHGATHRLVCRRGVVLSQVDCSAERVRLVLHCGLASTAQTHTQSHTGTHSFKKTHSVKLNYRGFVLCQLAGATNGCCYPSDGGSSCANKCNAASRCDHRHRCSRRHRSGSGSGSSGSSCATSHPPARAPPPTAPARAGRQRNGGCVLPAAAL